MGVKVKVQSQTKQTEKKNREDGKHFSVLHAESYKFLKTNISLNTNALATKYPLTQMNLSLHPSATGMLLLPKLI